MEISWFYVIPVAIKVIVVVQCHECTHNEQKVHVCVESTFNYISLDDINVFISVRTFMFVIPS